MPGAGGFFRADHAGEFVERDVDFVLDHRGAGERAAVHGLAAVDHQHGAFSICQRMRHQGTGNAGSDDDDVIVIPRWRLPRAERDAGRVGPKRAGFVKIALAGNVIGL